MNSGHLDPLIPLIRTAFPRDTAKVLTRELHACGHGDVTHRQSRRIVAGPRAPGRLRLSLLEIVDRAIARNRAAIVAAESVVRDLRNERVARTAAARRASRDRPSLASDPRPAARTTGAFLGGEDEQEGER